MAIQLDMTYIIIVCVSILFDIVLYHGTRNFNVERRLCGCDIETNGSRTGLGFTGRRFYTMSVGYLASVQPTCSGLRSDSFSERIKALTYIDK